MTNDTKEYLESFRLLPERRKEHYRTLRDESQAVLRLLFSRLAPAEPGDDGDPAFFDFDLFYVYATEVTSSVFTRYDCLVLDFLERGDAFERAVEEDKGRYPLEESAVIDAFTRLVADSPLGEEGALVAPFVGEYRAWVKSQGLASLSPRRVRERHLENVGRWRACNDYGEEIMGAVDPAVKTLADSFLDFMINVCHDSLDREIALLIERETFESLLSDEESSVLPDFKKSEYSSEMTEREMRLELDRVHRRLLAFFVVDGMADRLSNVGQGDSGYGYERAWVERAGLSSKRDARRVVEIEGLPQRLRGWDVRPRPADTLAKVVAYYRAQGVRVEPATTDGGQTLRLWYSLKERRPTDEQAVIVYRHGAYRDVATGASGWLRDEL